MNAVAVYNWFVWPFKVLRHKVLSWFENLFIRWGLIKFIAIKADPQKSLKETLDSVNGSWWRRYTITLAPEIYCEPEPVAMKPWVWVEGSSEEL